MAKKITLEDRVKMLEAKVAERKKKAELMEKYKKLREQLKR